MNGNHKILIFDAGTLITLSMTGLLDILPKLKQLSHARFMITSAVKYEVVGRPITVKRFELGALRIQQLIASGVLEAPSALDIAEQDIAKKTRIVLDMANTAFSSEEKNIHILQEGEASCMAASMLLSEKNIDNLIAVDERTARMISENPENLRQLLEDKLHTKIIERKENFGFFKNLRYIRSSELAFVAFKKGLIQLDGSVQSLDALLYATKFSGNSISHDEIAEMKKL